MSQYTIEINGKTILQTDSLDDIAARVAHLGLMTSTNIRNLPQFHHIALSADGDIICGYIFNLNKPI